jgi:exodeoxyribonuclease VII large subunit
LRYAGAVPAPTPDVRLGDREKPLSVAMLVNVASQMLEEQIGVVWIEGEVSTMRTPASGHVYFVLKDARAQIPAVMWRSDVVRLAQPLVEGQRFLCRGKVSLYAEQGKVQIYVDRAEPSGHGAAAARLAELRKRLAAEGLFAEARKRALPRFPRRIAVVTSPTGAAVRDIVRAVWRRFPTPIIVSPCKVQGEGAAADVAWAIRRAGRLAQVDVVIVGRGGGSAEDLSAFNDEPVVRAIVHCPVPVVSAVGHEIDVTLADLAADARAATPTAAGEMAVPDGRKLAEELGVLERRLQREARHGVVRLRAELERAAARLVHPGRRLVLQRQEIDELAGRAEAAMLTARQTRGRTLTAIERRLWARDPRLALREGRARLDGLAARAQAALRGRLATAASALGAATAALDGMSPLRVLDRGYAVVRTPEGHVVTSVESVGSGDALEVRLSDGTVDVVVR